jgi:predicted DsbA family dithiol-disulfide isomerase
MDRNEPKFEGLTINIVSDVVCPWCYVGKKRLEAALAELGHPEDIRITWHPFQLDPAIPAEGMERGKYFIKKFGNEGRIRQMSDHLTKVGEEEGIDFRFEDVSMAINTFTLHKLLHVAGQEGFQPEAEEILFKAYFTDTLDLRDVQVLAGLFAPYGWDEQKIRQISEDDAIGYEVRQEINHFQSLGVEGVPYFIINNKYGLSGAQPKEVFVQALNQVRDEILQSVQGEACGPEGC